MASNPRWGLGPVFAYEWLTRSRRWQAYALRGLFVLALLSGLGLVYQSSSRYSNLTARQQLVQAGQQFFLTMAVTQLSLVLLAAPAATAGAICLDKARGTLAHVMVTDLSDAEVVLGKLGARLVPVLNLVACALPVAALGTLLGGIDPEALTGALLIATGVAVLGCSLALAFSVWLAKAHEVVAVVYAIWALWILALPAWYLTNLGFAPPYGVLVTNPFWLMLAPTNHPGTTSLVEPAAFLLACLAASAGLAGLAVAKVRPVYLRQSGRSPARRGPSRLAGRVRAQVRRLPGPSLDGNPVLWREWHRARPSRPMRLVWALYVGLASAASLAVIRDQWTRSAAGASELAAIVNAFQTLIGLLLLSASAGTALSEERVRGSLDVLLATPLSTASIVRGKWWGAFRRAPWLAFWPAMVALSCLSTATPAWKVGLALVIPMLVVAQAAAVVSLGLAMATWVPRAGRAVAWTVSALVASTIGWPVLGFLFWGNSANSTIQMVTILGSPFYNVAMPTILLERNLGFNADMDWNVPVAAIFWTFSYSWLALGLFLATLLTFDRSLGRTPETPRAAGLDPYADPAEKPARRTGPGVRATPGPALRPASSDPGAT